jgi:hypothetical protein
MAWAAECAWGRAQQAHLLAKLSACCPQDDDAQEQINQRPQAPGAETDQKLGVHRFEQGEIETPGEYLSELASQSLQTGSDEQGPQGADQLVDSQQSQRLWKGPTLQR